VLAAGGGRATIASIFVGLVLLTLPACGDGPRPADVGETLRSALSHFRDGDTTRLCDLLSDRAARVIGTAAHAQPTSCRKDVRRYLKWLKPYSRGAGRTSVLAVAGDEGRARARMRLPSGETVTASFVEENGRWKMDGLFDATLSTVQARGTPAEARLIAAATRSRPYGGSSSVTVRRGRAPRACPPLTIRWPIVTGGCTVELDGKKLQLSVVGPFGEMAFARCNVSFDLHLDGTGRGWIMGVNGEGGGPCFDVMPCQASLSAMIPWRARIDSRKGDLRLRMDACLDTCVGRFAGEWDLDLVRRRGGWSARARQAMLGTSGWRFDGELRSRDDVDLVPRRRE
jgi:hypothetical protein